MVTGATKSIPEFGLPQSTKRSLWPCSKIYSILLQANCFVLLNSKTYPRQELRCLNYIVSQPARVTLICWGKIWNTAYDVLSMIHSTFIIEKKRILSDS